MNQSVWSFLPYLLLVVLTAIPSVRLLRRAGKSRWWAILSILPLGMLLILWIVAFGRWNRSHPIPS